MKVNVIPSVAEATLDYRLLQSYGLTPLILSADVVGSMHGDAERMPVTEMGKGIRIFYEALSEIARAN